jgi:hypothetical protein
MLPAPAAPACTNVVQTYAEDAAGNRSLTNTVSFVSTVTVPNIAGFWNAASLDAPAQVTWDPSSHWLPSKMAYHHRLVDDAHGVITAVAATTSRVADGTQFPALYAQHRVTTGLELAQVTVAGDHHYGTAHN